VATQSRRICFCALASESFPVQTRERNFFSTRFLALEPRGTLVG
jgi:hypothetical protein